MGDFFILGTGFTFKIVQYHGVSTQNDITSRTELQE